eukprot:CAMPEP_0204905962 /NCGR_PEP_ID=MMETSP1397-20131031/5722_1 /ASSEMBLY_ACC=CAM_ASM_000891 /TAXON_ID=49980 /ORGANISM="Climacostomum Climacostomum virens, Strain Stock W-24" /LENGTH=605 /DNA_ID=CAMNT_0052074917 /DNA_START=187 /DNA_END=2004 /DNA_ORIENTATION=-
MENTVLGEAGLYYENAECKAIEETLLGFNCWLKGCPKKKKSANLTSLKNHIEGFHKLKFCPICVKSRIAFTSEQHLYKVDELPRHMDYGEGDDIPPHPPCLFCNERYFDEEELRRHLQRNHFSCGLCDSPNVFYANYEKLKIHFIKAHYMCPDPDCQANRFVVFKTAYDLQDHNQSVHYRREIRPKKVDLSMLGSSADLPNTEGVDFTAQFAKKNKEEVKETKTAGKKKKKYSNKARTANIVDYKTLPLRSEKEVITLIREALDNDSMLFERLKKLMLSFSRSAIDATSMYRGFIEILGEGKGESLFPWAITTLKNPEKQVELHQAYIEGMQRATSSSRQGTAFSNCTDELSYLRALHNVITTEITKRKAAGNFTESSLSKSQFVMMQHAIDRLSHEEISQLKFLMHFGVSERGKTALTQIFERHTDSVFMSRLTSSYEDYFMKELTDAEIQVVLKYLEVGQNKLRGMIVRSEPVKLAYLEEKKKEEVKEEEPEESKWDVIRTDKRTKIPKQEEFPALSSEPSTSSKPSWGSKKPVYTKPTAEEFPSLAGKEPPKAEFPSLVKPSKPAEMPAEPLVAQEGGVQQEVKGQGKGRKKKPKTVIKLAG